MRFVCLACALALLPAAAGSAEPAAPAPSPAANAAPSAPPSNLSAWPESERAFAQDGPEWLLSEAEATQLATLDGAGRAALIAAVLADPVPETPENEMTVGIERRQRLMAAESLVWSDDRAHLLFLNGAPAERLLLNCPETLRPAEVWTYHSGGAPVRLVVYQPGIEPVWRLWRPSDGKTALYTPEMAYLLEQMEDPRGDGGGGRAGRRLAQLCRNFGALDQATGIHGIGGLQNNRPNEESIGRFLQPPVDRAAWARDAAATTLAKPAAELTGATLRIRFPEAAGQRLLARFSVTLPPGAVLQPIADRQPTTVRLSLEAVIEHSGRFFDTARARFEVQPPAAGTPLALVLDRNLRPGPGYTVRLRVKDEVGGSEAILRQGFAVPREPEPVAEPALPEAAVHEITEGLSSNALQGKDGLVLAQPNEDVVIGLWRAEAVVSGKRIVKVVFKVAGAVQYTRSKPPFTAELRLPNFPTELVVRAEGFDAEGALVAADDLVVNQPRGELRVRVVEPPRGFSGHGSVRAKAEVVVPEGRRVDHVEFRLGERTVATLQAPPWESTLDVPGGEDIVYLTAAAVLDDGSRAEDVRFLNAPRYAEQVDVNLVELFTTVTDSTGHPKLGLPAASFSVFEDGRPQKVQRFEQVENLPLTLGLVVDTSGSMIKSLGEARRAAQAFVNGLLTPRDRGFAITFSDRPNLIVPRTEDHKAINDGLEAMQAGGSTALWDAIVESLYYFRGTRGQRALVLLSDGDDTSSAIPFRDALEYARRSGVAIYTIGLGIGRVEGMNIRPRLEKLAAETGGRSFFVGKAEELRGVYGEIGHELRSQYLLAYSSDRPGGDGKFREVEVRVKDGLKARTIRGYYP